MRVRVLTLSLALVISGSTIGCKSAPKLPWFSSADTAKTGAAASTTASAAPTLPSEIAKQTEALAAGADTVKITTAPASTTAKTAGGAAPAYTPSAYPSTGAQDYLSNSAAALKTAASSTLASAATTAKSSLPYNPAAVPPSTSTTVSTPADAVPSADRYGLPSQDRYANTYPTTPAYTPGSFPTSTAPNPSDPTTPSSVPYAANPSAAPLGDRYAAQNIPSAGPTTVVPSSTTPTVQPASAVASVQPYRPGGTSSYPGTSANYEVATRPGSTSTSTATNGTLYR
jgi:S-DNA-T family DNA segregation ATPase FtsK/SpoIIIE